MFNRMLILQYQAAIWLQAITCSQRSSAQIRWADSDNMICSSQIGVGTYSDSEMPTLDLSLNETDRSPGLTPQVLNFRIRSLARPYT
jgi:hypothetical protein